MPKHRLCNAAVHALAGEKGQNRKDEKPEAPSCSAPLLLSRDGDSSTLTLAINVTLPALLALLPPPPLPKHITTTHPHAHPHPHPTPAPPAGLPEVRPAPAGAQRHTYTPGQFAKSAAALAVSAAAFSSWLYLSWLAAAWVGSVLGAWGPALAACLAAYCAASVWAYSTPVDLRHRGAGLRASPGTKPVAGAPEKGTSVMQPSTVSEGAGAGMSWEQESSPGPVAVAEGEGVKGAGGVAVQRGDTAHGEQ